MDAKIKPNTLGDLLKYDRLNNFSHEKVTLLSGSIYKIGSVLGKISASGKYQLSPASGSDGSQVASAILMETVDATFGDKFADAIVRGPLSIADKALVYHATVSSDALIAAKALQLESLGIVQMVQVIGSLGLDETIAISFSAPIYVGAQFTIDVTLPVGATLVSISATLGGSNVTLTGTGTTRTGTAAATGSLAVTVVATDAQGEEIIGAATATVESAPTAPSQFGASDWSVSTGLAENQVVLNVSALPSNGGSAITALQYTIDGGTTWTALSGTGTGARTLTMAASSTSYTFAVRAVNAVGNGTASATKTATSGSAAATAPAQFASGDWSVATGASANQITFTLTTLPANGGSAITALEYSLDGGTTWAAFAAATAGTYTISAAAAGTSYTTSVRAVNAVGNGAAAATKTVTSGASITLTQTQITNLKVYQRTTTTGGANGLGVGTVPVSVTSDTATPVYARLSDPDTDAVVVSATKIGDAVVGANSFTLAAPARLGWYRLDLAPSASGPWTNGTTRFGVGRVIVGVGQSQIGRLASKVDTAGGTIAALVPGATPYGSVRNHYTGSGYDTTTKAAGWQIPNDGTTVSDYNGVGAAELLRLEVAQHGVTCAWVCYGRSGGMVSDLLTGTSQTNMRSILAEAGGWEAQWIYIGGTDATNGTAEATYQANLTSLLADIEPRNTYTGTVRKIFTAMGTRYADGTIATVIAGRRAMKAVAAAAGGTWVEPRDSAMNDSVHPTQIGNLALAAAAHKALNNQWNAPTVVGSSISGAVITLTMSEAVELVGTPVGRVSVYPVGDTTTPYTVSSVTVSGSVLTVTLSAAPSGQVDVWLYAPWDSATKITQYIRAVDDQTPVEATTSAIVLGAANTVPAQFGTSDWSVATGVADKEVTLTVSALPSNGGSALTALQYTIDGGTTWTALSGTGTGARTLTMPAAGTAYTFALRAVNAVGNGPASATKTATSASGSVARAWVFTDTFTGQTDGTAIGGHVSTSGHTWAATAGGVLKNDGTRNGLIWTSGSANAYNEWSDDNVAIELDTVRYGSSPAGAPWILARVDAGGTNFYQVGTNQGGSLLRIGKTVSGTFTELANVTRTAPASGTQEKWRMEVEGADIRFYVNGVLMISANDTTFTAAGRIGLRSSNSDGTAFFMYTERKAMRAAPLETAPLAA